MSVFVTSAPGQSSTGFPQPGERVFEDTGVGLDPASIWGSVDCERRRRQKLITSGGDPHMTAPGSPQGDDSFRRLRVLDRDDFYGERCELGYNDHRNTPGPVYREGERRLTFISFRLPEEYPLGRRVWQVVMQMKQTWPSAGSGGVPALALHAFDGNWHLYSRAKPDPIWSAPARAGLWTRFAFDVVYSQHSELGRMQVFADVNGDGDAFDAYERSSVLAGKTLKREPRGNGTGKTPGPDGIRRGESIPSHLRAGVYHEPAIRCRKPAGCAIEVDNVGVYHPE